MPIQSVVLKPGREKAVLNRHHWIFSGAVKSAPPFENGDILPVRSAGGELLGHAYFNAKCSILGRMIAFGATPVSDAVPNLIRAAIAMRRRLFDPSETNAFRLVNAEGDGLPGLVADWYAGTVVLQISTLGIEKLKGPIVDTLVAELSPECVFEKSNIAARYEEGLRDFEGVLSGDLASRIEIRENGLRFSVDVAHGQKTGFFLDQREMRKLVGELSGGRRVLNAFSYTGGFSVAALRGGAARVDSVDISAPAIEEARRNVALNGFDDGRADFVAADVFKFLRERELDYDLVVLDPPAFAKKKTDVIQACRGYKEINRTAMAKVPPGSVILTCSCSHHVDEKLFRQVVFQAACEAKRDVRIIQGHHLAPDHPINIFHPEGQYLKSLVVYVA